MTSDAFICYSRRKEEFIQYLVIALGQNGFSLWFDSENLPKGVEFWEDIQWGILSSHIFIFILSEYSLASVPCQMELRYARSLNKPVLLIQDESQRFEDIWTSAKTLIDPDAKGLYGDNMGFSVIENNVMYLHSLPIYTFDRANQEAELHRLEHHIRDTIQRVTEHTKLLVMGKEWDQNQRNPNYLLKGKDLYEALKWLEKAPPTTSLQIAFINASQRRSKKHPIKRFLNRIGLFRNDRIFISYRRDDSQDICRSIYDELVKNFGRQAIFFDIDTIPHGADFAEYIAETMNQCSVFIAIIGDKWLDIRDKNGQRRLDDEKDWVRLEVQTALYNSNITVIPVLIGSTSMPLSEQLPNPLKELTYRSAMTVNNNHQFEGGMKKLIDDVKKARKV